MRSVYLLDSTLRDGGLGFEDAFIHGYSTESFDAQSYNTILGCLCDAKIDLIEVGSIEISRDDKRRFAIYNDIRQISDMLPSSKPHAGFAALYRGPDTPIEDIPPYDESLCQYVRVILRYSELRKSLDFCAALASKGYKVCVQPMLTMRYSEKELQDVIAASNNMGAFALYFVDSYGYMDDEDIKYFFDKYDSNLASQIKIGFHAHNNMNRAFANAIAFIRLASHRDVIVDSCVMGLGQGAGNLQTELIADYMIKKLGKSYGYDAILCACDVIDNICERKGCGYSVMHLLPAINKAAYKYGVDMRLKRGMTYKDINHVLKNMAYDLKQRYTEANLEIAIKAS